MAFVQPRQSAAPEFDGQLYRLIAETIPHLVWTALPDGSTDYFNRRTEEYTGRRSDELAGWAWKDVVHPEDRERCLAAWTRSLQTGERYDVEYRLRRADGSYRWHHGTAMPFHAADGRVSRWFGTCTEIENQLRSAQILEEMVQERTRALRESEQRFQLFMDHLPALAWIRDSKFRYTYVNRPFSQFRGLAQEDMIGRDASSFETPENAARVRESDQKVLADGVPHHYVDAIPAGRWLKVKFPFPTADGSVSVAGIGLDVSERSRLEEALHSVEQRFRFFMENAPAIAWIKDSDLRYTYVSGPYEKQVGKSRPELLGRDDFEIWPETVAKVFRENDEKVIRSGNLVQTFETSTRPDGMEQKWLVIKFPLADAAGKVGVAGMGVDISERVDAEEKVRQYAKEIRELMNRLVTTQELERRRLADNLHDLIGQNLTALGIELSVMKSGLSEESRKTTMPRLNAMTGLVNDTIQSIRGVMTELRPPALEEFGLVPALRPYVAVFGERTGMMVTLNVSGQGARLPRDAELALFRIVQEALTNAAKHSGGMSVEIAVTEFAGGIRLSVHDDGSGFDDRKGARGARRGGWGLPAMRERAEAHGGTLRIEFPARGTRLIVEIPGADAD